MKSAQKIERHYFDVKVVKLTRFCTIRLFHLHWNNNQSKCSHHSLRYGITSVCSLFSSSAGCIMRLTLKISESALCGFLYFEYARDHSEALANKLYLNHIISLKKKRFLYLYTACFTGRTSFSLGVGIFFNLIEIKIKLALQEELLLVENAIKNLFGFFEP